MNKQAGFTLIELSIALVLIGLILSMIVIKSGLLVGDTKTTSTITLIKDLSGAVIDFKSRYHYLPGDLPKAGDDIPNVSAACNIATSTSNIGNGLIDNSTESTCASEELVLAGFIKGKTTGIFSPFNNGIIPDVLVMSASTSKVFATNPFPPTVQNVIEISNYPCDAANEIDSKIDDGVTTSGNVRIEPACALPSDITTLDVAI